MAMGYYIKNLSKGYGTLQVLESLSIEFTEGEVTCILGPSGCGKSTLLNILTGAMRADSGVVSGFSQKRISYIFQEDRLIEWKTVGQNLEFVLKATKTREQMDAKINQYLGLTGMLEYKSYYPNKLSGGMRQRVAIVRAFICQSDVMIMDEPFKSMDSETKETVIQAFRELHREQKMTVILVTHDELEAQKLGDRVLTFSSKPATILSDEKVKK